MTPQAHTPSLHWRACRKSPPSTTRRRSKPAGKRSGTPSAPGRSPTPASPATTPPSPSPTSSRCCPTRRASPTSATSRTTPSATRSPTSAAAGASTSSTRWATTPSAFPPRTTRSAQASTRRGNPQVDRVLPRAIQALGHLHRLVARGLLRRPRLLPLDPVALPPLLREGPRLPLRGASPVVPGRRHRPRQRAGHRRPLRALRHPRRAEEARAVVLQDHRLRRPAPRRLRDPRVVARARRHHAAELDRALRGRGGHLHLRRAGHRLPRLHHPPRHPLRRDVLRRWRPSIPTSTSWQPARRTRKPFATTSPRPRASPPRIAPPRTARRPACRSGAPSPTR